jgi:glycosyltransferase involved in cell wall biosynthesis/SAM-dependent methyltransferase
VEARKTFAIKLKDGFIEKYLSGAAILDIGYRGYETEVLPIVPQAVGVDLDYPGYDGRTLPFPDGSQDAVFSSHCLEHVDDCRTAIREWFRVLRTGGYLVLMVPHKYLYERRLTPPSRWNLDHRRFFTPATLLMRIEHALTPNTYRIRHLIDNDVGYGYTIPVQNHPGGSHEIELVLEKIDPPVWELEAPSLNERRAGAEASDLFATDVANRLGKTIVYDGLNLALARGTGVATYTRVLSKLAHNLGYDVGVVYETPAPVLKDATLQDVLFFDQAVAAHRRKRKIFAARLADDLIDRVRSHLDVRPTPVALGKTVIPSEPNTLTTCDQAFAAKDLFKKSDRYFRNSGKFMNLSFEKTLDIFHCTYAIPLYSKGSCNVYTIHDLVPLRLPYSTLDDKQYMYRLLKTLVTKADHVVTVSECSKHDIINVLGISEDRVTNTYQAITFPQEYLDRSEGAVANLLHGLYGLETSQYLLFFGAIEPKKNVARLIDAYFSSGVDCPLVLVSGGGWQNEAELSRLGALSERASDKGAGKRSIRRLDYVTPSNLVDLIRGARGVVFPSLYEGFGLPVLEAMTLGTPVVTSSKGALAEIAGDAAVLVDPYDVDDIARGISLIANDPDLCGELSQRGLKRAEIFSVARYRERLAALYASLC